MDSLDFEAYFPSLLLGGRARCSAATTCTNVLGALCGCCSLGVVDVGIGTRMIVETQSCMPDYMCLTLSYLTRVLWYRMQVRSFVPSQHSYSCTNPLISASMLTALTPSYLAQIV